MKLRSRAPRHLVGTLAVSAALLALPSTAAAAERFYAATPENSLISFTSQAPNRILDRETIDGMATGETVIGMDMRPATGQLYALTSTGRILVVNRSSGSTFQIGTPITLVGTSFGFDFNPDVDRIRIVSNAEQNLRVHPETGAVAATDTPLAYRAGDAGAGSDPSVVGAAYTLSPFGAQAASVIPTELYAIDSARDTLVEIDPPNAGTLVTVGALGLDVSETVQYDIAGDQTGYAAFTSSSFEGVRLYSINEDTGAATTTAGSPRIGTSGTITAMTAVGQVSDDRTAPAVAVGNYTVYRSIWLNRGLNFTLSCPEDCNSVVTLRIGSVVAGTATVSISTAGTRTARIRLNAAGRVAAARPGSLSASLTFVTRDFANQKRTQVTRFTSFR